MQRGKKKKGSRLIVPRGLAARERGLRGVQKDIWNPAGAVGYHAPSLAVGSISSELHSEHTHDADMQPLQPVCSRDSKFSLSSFLGKMWAASKHEVAVGFASEMPSCAPASGATAT